jgi:hypothetical protein
LTSAAQAQGEIAADELEDDINTVREELPEKLNDIRTASARLC